MLGYLKKKFPAYYDSLLCTCPPEEAVEQDMDAYRFCYERDISNLDFLSHYEEKRKINGLKPGSYAISLFISFDSAIKIKRKFPRFRNMYMALGKIRGIYGPSIIEENEHINWWLYKDSAPWNDFKCCIDE